MIIKPPLTKVNYNKWKTNLLRFTIPLVILYLTTVIGIISQEGHLIALSDFIPTRIWLGGFILYILNAITDILIKVKEQLGK